VTSLLCNQPGATLSLARSPRWDANFGGQIVVSGTPFCLNVSSQILSDGEPAITLAPCDASATITPFQLFAALSSSGNSSYASHVTGECLDLVSGTQAPNEQLELYGCSGNPNQCVWEGGAPPWQTASVQRRANLAPHTPTPTSQGVLFY
jgi:hypothetical protein